MKTVEEIVQDFLFKDKPKRSYCHKRDVKDWVNLLQQQIIIAVEQKDEEIKAWIADNVYITNNGVEAIIKSDFLKFIKQ